MSTITTLPSAINASKSVIDTNFSNLNTDKAELSGGTFTGDISVPDEAYGTGWNGSMEVPTKNALYDKIETISGGGVTDHGALTGLTDDDHTQYTKADGTRAFSGKVSYSSHPTFSSDTELVDKKYVDDSITAGGGYTDEQAQDAVGSILVDSSTIDFTYNDGTPSITASVIDGSITTTKLGGDITTAGKALLDDADASAQRTTLGLSTTANQTDSTDKRFMTDAQEAKLDAISGTNTGDETTTRINALYGTSNAFSAGSIELGHASDTTISRVSAGVVAVEGVTVPTISSTNTITNKRIQKRVVTTTQSATPTINTDNGDIFQITGLAQAITSMTTNLTGTPVDGEMIEIIFVDNGTARAITWGASFESTTVTLPTTTVISTMLRVVLQWKASSSKWSCVGIA